MERVSGSIPPYLNTTKSQQEFKSSPLVARNSTSSISTLSRQPSNLYPTMDSEFTTSTSTTNPSSRFLVRPIANQSKILTFPTAFHLKGSVWPNILIPVLLFTLWSGFILALATYGVESPQVLTFPPLFITIISLVLSLLLVFRTNTAYDRYWEGRRLWGTMITLIRNLSRIIMSSLNENNNDVIREEKLSFLNVLLAIFIAEKNHLQNEPGLLNQHNQPRKELLTFLPSSLLNSFDFTLPISNPTSSSSSSVLSRFNSSTSIHSPKKTLTHTPRFPISSFSMAASKTNLALLLCHYLTSFLIEKRKLDQIDAPHYSNSMNQLMSLTDVVSQLERIVYTPIPAAYSIHMKQALYIYLLLLPFQMLQLKWVTILIVLTASFTLLGIAGIASEIENPFGHDANDLPLDQLQGEIRQELEELSQVPYFSGPTFSWDTVWNQPPLKEILHRGVMHRQGSFETSEIILPQHV